MSLKVDFHVHSNASKDGRMSLDEIARAAKEKGLDAVFVCDHNCYGVNEVTKVNDVYLMPGCEISTRGAHVLAVLCDTKVDIEGLRKNGLPTTDEAFCAIKNCGGISILAHPYEYTWDENSISTLPVCVEVSNARAWLKNVDANKKALEFANRKGLVKLAGSDSHLKEEIGNAYTVVDCDTVDGIKEAVLKGRTEAVLVKNTDRVFKAKSQLTRYKRDNKALKGYAYYIYTILRGK